MRLKSSVLHPTVVTLSSGQGSGKKAVLEQGERVNAFPAVKVAIKIGFINGKRS
jgi:hypothetical protein